MSYYTTFNINGMELFAFKREGSATLLFSVREFDTKAVRHTSSKRGRGPSEQALRASIRQAILNLELRSIKATKAEIKFLKSQVCAALISLLPFTLVILLVLAFVSLLPGYFGQACSLLFFIES
jgi:hypothetical protein